MFLEGYGKKAGFSWAIIYDSDINMLWAWLCLGDQAWLLLGVAMLSHGP